MSTHSTVPSPAGQPAVSDGCVVAVRGTAVDVRFAGDQLPAIDDALFILPDDLAPVLAEVQAHLSETTVRALALQSTAGLRRGVRVRACGGPIEAPVGEAVLGRQLDVTGATRDDGEALPALIERRPIHRLAPLLAALSEGVFDAAPAGIVAQVRTQLAARLQSQRVQSELAKARAGSPSTPFNADIQAALVAAVRELVQQLTPPAASGAAGVGSV